LFEAVIVGRADGIALAVILFLLRTAGVSVEVAGAKNNDRSCPGSNPPPLNIGTVTKYPDNIEYIMLDSK
jgi:hypothetical protein